MTIDKDHAKRIVDLVVSLDPTINRLCDEIETIEDHAMAYNLRRELGDLMGCGIAIMLPIERIYPDLNPDEGKPDWRPIPRGPRDNPVDREFAISAKAYALTTVRALHSIVKETEDWQTEEMQQLRKAIGISIGRIEVDILRPIYTDHKDIDDLTEADYAASDHLFEKPSASL